MTDNEIIKALECLSGIAKDWDCDKCPFDSAICTSFVAESTLDLINRLQEEKQNLEIELKAMRGAANSYKDEVERLKENLEEAVSCFNRMESLYNIKNMELKVAKTEAYKEFAELLKKQKYQSSDWSHGEHPFVVEERDIDNTLDELVGEDK